KNYLAERTTMLAAISHDIRTGLFRLRMRSEKIDDPVERAKALEDADEMAAILDDMLTFARSDQNDVGFERLSLPSLLTTICDNLVDQDKDAVFESGGRMTVVGDPTSLKRGFLNLIENATKYGLRARVSTERLPDKGRLRVTIDDDGPGIAEEERDRVFRPFVRLEDSRNRKTGGTGLGLAIVKKVMDRHGATIRLDEAPGGGLRVMVEMDFV
ncbi:MAG: ATP-binding protein, partial [Pseudomonadota bacterium]|nr:ATP-binding protein [Pseudomonadota bacterium]